MTATATKPRTRKKAFPKQFNMTYLRKGRRLPGDEGARGMPDDMGLSSVDGLSDFDKAFEEAKQEVLNTPVYSPLEMKVTTFFSRLERVTVHVLDRLGTLALKGAAYIDGR